MHVTEAEQKGGLDTLLFLVRNESLMHTVYWFGKKQRN